MRENLEVLLETRFPRKEDKKKEELSVECGICYAYRLQDQLPERVCDNPKCARPFHRMCLYEVRSPSPSFLLPLLLL